MTLQRDFDNIQSKFDKLQQIADAQVSPPKQFKKYTDHTKEEYQWSRFNNMWGTFRLKTEYYYWSSSSWGDKVVTKEAIEQTLSQFDKAFEQWKKDNEEIHNYNLEVIKHNTLQRERVKTLMETLGVKERYSEWKYKTPRSRNRTETKHTAGYVEDLKRIVPIQDGHRTIINQIHEKRDVIKRFGEKHLKFHEETLRKQKLEQEQKEKEQRRVNILAALRLKYTPDNLLSEEDDVLETILLKDKYLHLAHHLLMNRNDWTDGYDCARQGLHCFEVISSEDQEIFDCIEAIVDSYDNVDGRHFRDCEYSYDYLFDKVDNALIKDYNSIMEFVEIY